MLASVVLSSCVGTVLVSNSIGGCFVFGGNLHVASGKHVAVCELPISTMVLGHTWTSERSLPRCSETEQTLTMLSRNTD